MERCWQENRRRRQNRKEATPPTAPPQLGPPRGRSATPRPDNSIARRDPAQRPGPEVRGIRAQSAHTERRKSEGKKFGGDSCVDLGQGPSRVLFQGELAVDGLEDEFDPLPDSAESAEAWLLVLAVRADQMGTQVFGDEPFEVPAGEALVAKVAKNDLSGTDQVVVMSE
jgi:hypothetical protein